MSRSVTGKWEFPVSAQHLVWNSVIAFFRYRPRHFPIGAPKKYFFQCILTLKTRKESLKETKNWSLPVPVFEKNAFSKKFAFTSNLIFIVVSQLYTKKFSRYHFRHKFSWWIDFNYHNQILYDDEGWGNKIFGQRY